MAPISVIALIWGYMQPVEKYTKWHKHKDIMSQKLVTVAKCRALRLDIAFYFNTHNYCVLLWNYVELLYHLSYTIIFRFILSGIFFIQLIFKIEKELRQK